MSSGISCSICTEIYKGTDAIYSTTCGHVFHFHCMQQWQSRSSSCPQCRHYNPETHKLYLNIDDSPESVQKMSDMKLQLEQLKNKLEESERESSEKSVELKSQLEKSILNGSKLEQRLEQSERDFLAIQGQYNTKEDELRELRINVECLTLQSDLLTPANASSKEMRVSDIVLDQKNKILEEKLKAISLELAKQIRIATELAVDKMQLQALVNQFETTKKPPVKPDSFNSETQTKDSIVSNCMKTKMQKPQANVSTKIQLKNINHNELINLQAPNKNTQGENFQNCVVIIGLNPNILKCNVSEIALILAKQMELTITADDIVSTSLLERNFDVRHNIPPEKVSFVVRFKELYHKVQFLSNKEKLKNNVNTNRIIVHEYVTKNFNVLFLYAKKLRTCGYRFVYCRNNAVFARLDKTKAPTKIQNMQQVDQMMLDSLSDHCIRI